MLFPLLQRIVTGDGAGSESTPSRMSTSGSSTSSSSPFLSLPQTRQLGRNLLLDTVQTPVRHLIVDFHQRRCLNPSHETQSHHLPTVFSM